MPVPAGPIPKVTVQLPDRVDVLLLRHRLRRDLLAAMAPDDVARRPRGCPRAWSSAPSTASTVDGPISCPPSTSSTSSSTTARASATLTSSPSIVSRLPRRRIVHSQPVAQRLEDAVADRRASSAATSFETSRDLLHPRSVYGVRARPRPARAPVRRASRGRSG